MVIQQRQQAFKLVTLGHIRSHGCRDLLVYCISPRCHHSNGDWLADETPVRAFCSGMVCNAAGCSALTCGRIDDRTSMRPFSPRMTGL